jgi:hypothetical protein
MIIVILIVSTLIIGFPTIIGDAKTADAQTDGIPHIEQRIEQRNACDNDGTGDNNAVCSITASIFIGQERIQIGQQNQHGYNSANDIQFN